jgi:sialate O-acetylesterase
MKYICRLVLLLLSTLHAAAEVSLPVVFTDHAVLQQGKPVPVWGWAGPGEKVTVSYRGAQAATVTAADGKWSVALPAMTATAGGGDLVVAGENTITLKDVVVGEVWFCSGQSNMAFSVEKTPDAKRVIAEANDPLLRVFRMARTVSDQPLDKKQTARAGRRESSTSDTWLPVTPQMIGGHSAVACFFAQDLRARLGVPVGVITSSWGGSPIESWLPHAGLVKTSVADVVANRWKQAQDAYPERKSDYDAEKAKWDKAVAAAKAAGKNYTKRAPRLPVGPGSHHTPSGLFNGMVHPCGTFALRGFVWYQGESNAQRAGEYAELMRALVTGWRGAFAQDDAYFLWVQLPRYDHSEALSWSLTREAQAAQLILPRTGQAVTIDLEIPAPREVHPPDKKPVADRLARVAMGLAHGAKEEYIGPRFQSMTTRGTELRVQFEHADGLAAKGSLDGAFEIAGADQIWHPAQAGIEGEVVVLSSPKVRAPVAARYLFRNYPERAPLHNQAGLPAEPFRTDDWKPVLK